MLLIAVGPFLITLGMKQALDYAQNKTCALYAYRKS
jgi:hypothetical protein